MYDVTNSFAINIVYQSEFMHFIILDQRGSSSACTFTFSSKDNGSPFHIEHGEEKENCGKDHIPVIDGTNHSDRAPAYPNILP